MRRKQMNNDPNYNVIVSLTKSAQWNVCSWTLISQTKPDLQQWIRLSVVIRNESGITAVFIHVLMCTAYTNLTNTFLISFLSKTAICRRCLRLRPSK